MKQAGRVRSRPAAWRDGRVARRFPKVAPFLRVRGYNVPEAANPVLGVQDGPSRPPFRFAGTTPNPFAGRTSIAFDLAGRERVRVWVCDVNGRLVRTLIDGIVMAPGGHRVEWDGRSDAGALLSSGLYLDRLEAGSRSEARRIALVR